MRREWCHFWCCLGADTLPFIRPIYCCSFFYFFSVSPFLDSSAFPTGRFMFQTSDHCGRE
jgi:hypothetical protein